ncbi:MAG: Asp-tRNA(Asn)/Glu-tRNA(Gln) amidotransferase subunit GatA [Clostridiales bacterium]|nr:Asp-tRNA(Asn)/Glu-tRNA(Gln) amidotransferase subunit GatA [Clostridiales bacterium]
MDIIKLTAREIREKIIQKELTCVEVVSAFLAQIEKCKEYNALLEVFDDAMDLAREMDKKVSEGFSGKLAGVPVVIKDNILYKGKIMSCASKLLENYVAQYNSTVVDRMLEEGAIIIGRANMDEFAMGSSTENSAFGVTHNPVDYNRVAGGSSGGSACAVALNMCPIALGTDTGGSVRQPASYCGIYGLKPTYGRISRYGVVAYGSSLDQVGVFARNVEDCALMLEVLAGQDCKDETSTNDLVDEYVENCADGVEGITVGVPKEIMDITEGMPSRENLKQFIQFLKDNGVKVVEVSIKDIALSFPAYYIIADSEAASNLARFDGVKYTSRSDSATNLQEIYKKSRSEGFGKEVKNRIMLGNYVLSSGYFDAYYKKALNFRGLLVSQFNEAFQHCDLIIAPTTIGEAYFIGSKPSDPVETYKEDVFTVPINMVQIPSLNIPFGKGENGMPLGMQLMAKKFNENTIFKMAKFIEDKRGQE